MKNGLGSFLAAEPDFPRRPGRILLDKLRSVDKMRLVKHLGQLDAATLSKTLAALHSLFTE